MFQELHPEKAQFPLMIFVLVNQDIVSLMPDNVVPEYHNRSPVDVDISQKTWFPQCVCLSVVCPYQFPKIG